MNSEVFSIVVEAKFTIVRVYYIKMSGWRCSLNHYKLNILQMSSCFQVFLHNICFISFTSTLILIRKYKEYVGNTKLFNTKQQLTKYSDIFNKMVALQAKYSMVGLELV